MTVRLSFHMKNENEWIKALEKEKISEDTRWLKKDLQEYKKLITKETTNEKVKAHSVITIEKLFII